MSDATVPRDKWCSETLAGHDGGLCSCAEIQEYRQHMDRLCELNDSLRAQRDALAEELAKLQKKYEQADVERGLMACLVMESWEAKQVMADRDEYELAKQIMAQHALAAAPEAGKP